MRKPALRLFRTGVYRAGSPISPSVKKEIKGCCAGSTRHGFFRISSLGSGAGASFLLSFAFPSLPSFFLSLSTSMSLASPAAAAAAAAAGFSDSSTSTSMPIMSLAKSLAATESAVDPTIVVPWVAATDMASRPVTDTPSAMELLTDALSSASASVVAAVAPFFNSSSLSFFSLSCLALAAVDKTAVATFACSSFFGGCMGSGYAKIEGLALHFTEKFFGIFNLSFKPISAVGVKVKENMWIKGNQYHIWAKSAKPIAAPLLNPPECEKKEAQQLRPPASKMPFARIAPKRTMTSSCLSPTTFDSFSRNSFTFSDLPGDVCM
mmetsp:Transcript_51748/g.95749  ORF Transcript_51748/g.95749 Transcript_51748/m.95749 type:complete len:322 (+) Transcript_51748:228-1193(+)